MPLNGEHQRYRKLAGQKAMAEAWYRLMQRTCQQAEELSDVDNNSELTMAFPVSTSIESLSTSRVLVLRVLYWFFTNEPREATIYEAVGR